MRRIVSLLLAVLVYSLISGGLAFGQSSDAGVVLDARMHVGKSGDCSGAPTGGGIGLPVLDGVKRATWLLRLDSAIIGESVMHGSWLPHSSLCGRMGPVLGNVAAVGASCSMSNGHSGSGYVHFADGSSIYLQNLEWKASATALYPGLDGIFVMTGQAGTSPSDTSDAFVALVRMSYPGVGCLDKWSIGKGRETDWWWRDLHVEFVYALLEGQGWIDQHVGPLCKGSLNDGCLYEAKS